jgi:hypothetical protein
VKHYYTVTTAQISLVVKHAYGRARMVPSIVEGAILEYSANYSSELQNLSRHRAPTDEKSGFID